MQTVKNPERKFPKRVHFTIINNANIAGKLYMFTDDKKDMYINAKLLLAYSKETFSL